MSRRTLALLPEVALVLLSVAVVATCGRLFTNTTFFLRLATFAVASHALAHVLRRRNVDLLLAALVSVAGFVVIAIWLLYPSSTLFGMPTADSISAVRHDFGTVYDQFQSVRSPTAVTPAFLLALGGALWWAAFVADWAAFRLWTAFEAIIPASSVFIFVSLFADKAHRIDSAALYGAAALGFLLSHRVARQRSTGVWVSDETRGPTSLLRVGGALIAVTVVLAAVVGPRLPGSTAEPVVSWRQSGTGPAARTTVSPMVQIKSRLVEQSDQELFTVQSDRRAYWRLTSLDRFDGNVWSSSGSYDKAHDSLPSGFDSNAPITTAEQTFQITALDTIWLPAAFQAARLQASGIAVRWEPVSSTLIVGTSLPSSDGLRYRVQSALPAFDAATLARVPSEDRLPDTIAERDLGLPPDFSRRAASLARSVVDSARATTPYAQALALQNWFRTNFTYDLRVPAGHSESAIDAFLTIRRGYCEQFAGTYAAMARSLGIPARVAVGFTPGEADGATRGLLHVQGRHAHAWPEVWIPSEGWVLFEPTPGRGAPNAEQYTGVPEQQAAATGGGATTTPTTGGTQTSPTTRPGGSTPTTRPGEQDLPAGQAPSGGPSFLDRWGGRLLILLATAFVIVGLWAIAVPALHRWRRNRRRNAARDHRDRVRVAWLEALEAAGAVGLEAFWSDTPEEISNRAERLMGGEEWGALADLLERAEFSAEGVSETDVAEAAAISASIGQGVNERLSRGERVRSALDPRTPLRRGPASRRDQSSRWNRSRSRLRVLPK